MTTNYPSLLRCSGLTHLGRSDGNICPSGIPSPAKKCDGLSQFRLSLSCACPDGCPKPPQVAPRVACRLWIFTLCGLILLLIALITGCRPKPPEGMVLVPAGEFVMGSDEVDAERISERLGINKPWFEDEHPAHKFYLEAFFIDQYEVTNAQYQKFIDTTGHSAPPYWRGKQYPRDQGDFPVMVGWTDAQSYCQWAGKRLPTEAEWEKAARGADGRRYPWGNEFDPAKANVGETQPGRVKVGSYPAGRSPYGAYDMIGNVWEWTSDWYQPYPGSEYRSQYFGERYKVIRGNAQGGVGHFPAELASKVVAHNSRASFRFLLDPAIRLSDVGIRCVKEVPHKGRS